MSAEVGGRALHFPVVFVLFRVNFLRSEVYHYSAAVNAFVDFMIRVRSVTTLERFCSRRAYPTPFGAETALLAVLSHGGVDNLMS